MFSTSELFPGRQPNQCVQCSCSVSHPGTWGSPSPQQCPTSPKTPGDLVAPACGRVPYHWDWVISADDGGQVWVGHTGATWGGQWDSPVLMEHPSAPGLWPAASSCPTCPTKSLSGQCRTQPGAFLSVQAAKQMGLVAREPGGAQCACKATWA